MSNMDVWRYLRWVSVSIVTLWCHFHSSSDPGVPNLGPTWPMQQYKGATICTWDSVPMLKTFYICLIWMYEEVWGGYRPQTWGYDVIFTPQVALTYQIWGQLVPCNSMGATVCIWDSIPMLKTLYICLIWMYEDVWGGYQPQPWGYDVIFTPQVTLT